MYQPLLNLHTWVSLPNEVRYKIRGLFNVPRSGNVVVNDGVIETDGTTTDDLHHLTVEKMQSYLHSNDTDFNKLFDSVVVHVKNGTVPVNIPEVVEKEIINANIKVDVKKTHKKSK